MTNEEKLLEEKYLKKVLKQINFQKDEQESQYDILLKNKHNYSEHFSEDFYTMDDEEQAEESQFLGDFEKSLDHIKNNITRLNKISYSPFFGRIDFKEDSSKKQNAYYIGVNNVVSQGCDIPLVCDWRAPVSSLFYDYELGSGMYDAPDGKHDGKISLKRQYKIKNGKMLGAFDSTVTIGDDILRDVLSQNASKKMQTIIGTIQKEQNKIIRSDMHKNLIVQGVAGSGKTSIALHRIAYLLYQNRSTIKAENILILSPNTLFSEYISNVLPELGEENMAQTSFYKLAKQELDFLGYNIETREECLNNITNSRQALNESAYKNTYDFYESLVQFAKSYFDLVFTPKDIKLGKQKVTAKELSDLYYNTYKAKTPAVRVQWLVDYILDKFEIEVNINDVANRLKKMIYPFFEENNIINIYSSFLNSIGMSFSLNSNNMIRYDDLGALLYLKYYFFGIQKQQNIKYLIIDEMQDYSFLHYEVFNALFDCNKIVLGDINQCIDKIMTEEDLKILAKVLNADVIKLDKAYRSTYEIAEFCNGIKGITCEITKRHGEKPIIISCAKNEFFNSITEQINNMQKYDSIAILVKNESQAKDVYANLSGLAELGLCLGGNDEIRRITVMPSYIAKGLEFDAVIVPYYNNYLSQLDKNLLYVSCSRALHELILIGEN